MIFVLFFGDLLFRRLGPLIRNPNVSKTSSDILACQGQQRDPGSYWDRDGFCGHEARDSC